MIRLIPYLTQWIPQASACLTKTNRAPSTVARIFFTESKTIPNPFIQNNAPPINILAIALKSAVDSGKLKQVQCLLQTGAKANQAFDDGFFILHLAAETLHSKIVKELIAGGAHINIKTLKEGNTPLHIACALSHKLVVEELLQNKAKYHERNNAGNTPLEEAVIAQSAECCKLLHEAGANINEQNPMNGYTPLMTACKLGAYKIVKLLLTLDANRDFKGPPSSFPTEGIDPNIRQLLLTHPAPKHRPTKDDPLLTKRPPSNPC